MEGEDENSRFKGNLTADGVASLKARIEEKLKDFMGDYTDDALVDYVIVLLRNGRRKAEAAHELQVFLGDDNTSFVSWLWDHLSSNLHLYVEPTPPLSAPKSKGAAKRARDWNAAAAEEKDKEEEDVAVDTTTTSTSASVAGQKEQNDSSKRQKIVWEEGRDSKVERDRERPRLFRLRSVVTSVLNPAEKGGDTKSSGGSRNERRRGRDDDSQPIKRDPPARMAVNAPHRLLQFAVRDAVKPKQHAPSPTAESAPTLSRLRSFISAPASESLQGRDEEDNVKEMEHEGKYSSSPSPRPTQTARPVIPVSSGTSRAERSSVFDRLGRSRGTMETSRAEIEDKYSSDSTSDKDHYDKMEYSVAQEKEAEVVSKEVPAVQTSQIGSKPSKILNISVNVNTWKPPDMVQETHSFSLQNNKVSQAEKTEDPVPAVVQKILPKNPIPVATRSLEDPDSRTLFVSNVHFGATKDALSRHFNKFGAVLKVIILADVNTGQPTGSAYVEFLQKESAEAALSLNGTSFMSRILKVVRKTSQESGPTAVTGWGPTRGAHISSFPSHPAVRPPYMARGRVPVRGGRSLQWKRGGQSSDATSVPNAADTTRSFTYTHGSHLRQMGSQGRAEVSERSSVKVTWQNQTYQ